MAKCKFCGGEVVWIKDGRKNVPVEGDGGVHKCQEMAATLESIKKIEINELSEEEKARYNRPVVIPKKRKRW